MTTYKESNNETEEIKFVRNQRKENVETEMKSKTKLLLIGLMLVGLSGCAQYIWRHGQFNQAAWNRDTYECERDMRQSAYFGGGIAGAIAAGEFQERCLVAKGYWKERVEERKEKPATAAQEPPTAAIGDAVY